MRRQTRPLRLVAAAALLSLGVHAAPDEEAYGKSQGYPVGDKSNWFTRGHLVGAQSNMDRIFNTRAVKAQGPARPLPAHEKQPDWPFVQTYLDNHPATGLLVLQDGKLLLERYEYGRSASDRFTSFSMAKTVVGMAVGIAVAEGRIASIEDPVDKYQPALANSAWKGVAIHQVLNMSSGVKFDETYDKPDTDIARLSRPWTRDQGTLLQSLQAIQQVEAKPGERFKYVSAETQVLAQVLVAATGRSLSDWVGEKLWSPMGAEADAAWVIDGSGMEAGYCCFSARLRDYARLGQLLLDGGRVDARPVIPADWVAAATTVRLGDGHLQPRCATPYLGYGYQTWILPDNFGFALLGVRGQAVYVHPRTRLVMVQTAVWPSSSDMTLGRARDQFWRELVQQVSRW